MPPVKSPILGGFSESRSKNASDNTAINIFLELIETKDGKVPGSMYNAAGLDLVGTIGTGPIRGVRQLQDLLFVVSGNQVWSLTPNGIATLCGTIGVQKTLVSMFDNGKQLMIVDGVGAWLVPGGLPLTGGTIAAPTATTDDAGGLYALNDEIVLQASSGFQSSFPTITVTGITNNPVTTFTLPNAGTDYNSATGVPTTGISGQPGVGTGFTITITSGSGPITAASIDTGGTAYNVGDTGTVNSGTADAVYQVTGVGGGGNVTSFRLLFRGTSYGANVGVHTTNAIGVPPNAGTGLTLSITASAGPITASGVTFGGQNYTIGNVGFLPTGSGDATYFVTGVGSVGNVTSFEVTSPGSISAAPAQFTQKSTTGSGSGFILTNPTFGDFVGLVPVDMPFPNPLVGGTSDGFGILVFLGQQDIAASDELDLSTWQALSFGVADQSSDNCMSLIVLHDEAYILKERNAEVWVDQGTTPFPLGPLTGVHIEHGCVAPFSVAKVGEEVIWLSRNDQGQGIVVKVAGYSPQEISTQALVAEFEKYPNLGDAIGYGRQQGGHLFYTLTFPEANKSWVYDVTASRMAGVPVWHQIAAFLNGNFNRHWGNCFWPWRGSVTITNTPVTYQAQSVEFTTAGMQTAGGLVGLPTSFAAAVFSTWLFLPDTTTPAGIVFGNQGSGATPGLQITIMNDGTGSPEITIEAWDASANPIVLATYDFTTWAAWVNIIVSIDTATQQLQVYANTLVSAQLVETLLTAASITWTSSNPIAPSAAQPWSLISVS
jgi:hypothetical protein